MGIIRCGMPCYTRYTGYLFVYKKTVYRSYIQISNNSGFLFNLKFFFLTNFIFFHLVLAALIHITNYQFFGNCKTIRRGIRSRTCFLNFVFISTFSHVVTSWVETCLNLRYLGNNFGQTWVFMEIKWGGKSWAA